MNALLLRNGRSKNSSLQSFNEYRQTESLGPQCVTSEGLLLEYETLELRLHPPNVQIDNETYDDVTVITIDSANRPGTLIEVVQCLTELGLSIRRARISSDGGWFVDEFFVTETLKGKVLDPRKLALIKQLLSVASDAQQGHASYTTFELSGRDYSGLLVAVLQHLVNSECELVSAAVWTFHNRCAIVVGVTHKGAPVTDAAKSAALQRSLKEMLGGEDAVVRQETVRGDIHHERRLHHLLLLEELRSWEEQQQQVIITEDATGATTASAASASTGAGTSEAAAAAPPPLAAPRAELPSGASGARLTERSTSWNSATSAGASTSAQQAQQQASQQQGQGQPQPLLLSTAPSSSSAAGATATLPSPSGGGSASSTPALTPSGPSPPPPGVTFERLSSGPRSTAPGASPIAPAPTASLSSDALGWDLHSPTRRIMPADVKIQHSPILNYWLVTIVSKDRNKLFFDTVCTFADLNYDVYHSTIDSEGDSASQLFYVRPRYGEAIWDAERAHKLKYMLESAVQRRFPKGLKMHVQASDQRALLDLFKQLSAAGFWVTRAEVRTHADVCVYNFSLTDNLGQLPTQGVLQRTCEVAGGVLVDDLDIMGQPLQAAGSGSSSLSRTETFPARQLQALSGSAQKLPGNLRFAFSFLDSRRGTGGGGGGGGGAS